MDLLKQQPQQHYSKYRKDIDGLRAIAVLLVVYAHKGLPFFTGGFIGVDVFFVLSGFLITQIIYREINEGTFSFHNFYIRRIRRLLPALVFVLCASLLAFSFILSPHDLQRLTQSILWVSIFVGNFFFWIYHGGYFGENAKEAPLLHTWSLAIEEQFYFIWPFALIICLWLIPKRFLPIFLSVILLALVWLSEVALNYTLGAAYYLLPTRFFELMTGAVLAIGGHYLPTPKRILSNLGSLIALGVIFYMAVSLDETSRFPGYNAFYVCLATAVLLHLGKQPHNVIAQLLSSKPMVFFGLISYSLYLWHWPILVWFRYQDITLSAFANMCVFAIMVSCAWVSWRFVEKPFRKATTESLSKLTGQWLALPLVMFSAVALVTIQQAGFPTRFDASVKQIEQALNSHSNIIRGSCHSSLRDRDTLPNPDCLLGDLTAKKTGFLFGDSHANHYTGFLDVLGQAENILIQDYTMDQCPPLIGLEWGSQAYRAKECMQRNAQAWRYIQANKPDYVFLAASWPGWNTRSIYQDGKLISDQDEMYQALKNALITTVSKLQALDLQVILFKDTAYAEHSNNRCALKNALFEKNKDCSFEFVPNQMMDLLISEIMLINPNIITIDIKPFYCVNGRCATSLDDIPIYRDNNHLTHIASSLLGTLYTQAYKLEKYLNEDQK
ncbi:MAG: acyltransferase [Paraglaciecola sp.]|nr:acyltransferase [Paraglaciecola sp.]